MDADNSTWGQWAAGAGAAVVAGALALRKFVQGDRVSEAKSQAEVEVVNLLREEVNRQAESNSSLSQQVQDLTHANMVLQSTVHTLQLQVKTLQAQLPSGFSPIGGPAGDSL